MVGETTLEAVPFVDGIVYGEGPRWHDGRLWFTDGLAGKVYSAGEKGDLTTEVELARASGLGWKPDGTLVVSTLFEAAVHYVEPSGSVVASLDLSDIAWSTNDLLVTPDGRAYVNLYQRGARDNPGAIGLVGDDGVVRVVATGIALPNGMGLLPDGVTLVVNECNGGRILAYAADHDGILSEARVFADLGPDRTPDGLCVDVDGAVWVGSYATGEFLRVLDGGTVTHRVEVPSGWAVAPALGGADGCTLYLVVDDTTIDGLVRGESTGWILQARVDVPGAGSP